MQIYRKNPCVIELKLDMKTKLLILRYKLWRLSSRIFLGKLFGKKLGLAVSRNIDEAKSNPIVGKHLLETHNIAVSKILKYSFPNNFPEEFPREELFPSRNIYLLNNVAVSGNSGRIWIPDVTIFQQSVGSVPRIYDDETLLEATLKLKHINELNPIVPFRNYTYFHILLETLPVYLHANKFYPNCKLLMNKKVPGFVNSILNFLNIDSSKLLLESNPVLAEKAILVPMHVNGGFIPQEDVEILREWFIPRITKVTNKMPSKIYISRAKSINRSIFNEKEIEEKLRGLGFEIIYFEEIPFSSQLSYIYYARYIVAPHGAGLANLIVAQPKTKVLEILSRNWFNTCYAKLAVQLGLEYSYVETCMKNDKLVVDLDLVIKKINA